MQTTITDEQITGLANLADRIEGACDGPIHICHTAALAIRAVLAAVPAQPTQPQPESEHDDPTHPNHPGHHDGHTCESAAQCIVDLNEVLYPGSGASRMHRLDIQAASNLAVDAGLPELAARLRHLLAPRSSATQPQQVEGAAPTQQEKGASALASAELVSASDPSEREVMKPFVTEFLAALHGARGDLDAWLEVNDESECRNVIKEAIAAATAEQTRSAACGGCPPNESVESTISPEPAKVGRAGELTDSEIVAELHKCAIDTYPSKYDFPETQVSATNVANIRRVVMGCMNILAAKASGVQAADRPDLLLAIETCQELITGCNEEGASACVKALQALFNPPTEETK